jgi:hypothetical protein
MFRDLDPGRGTKRKADKERQDPRKSRRPELPVTGPGKGGRVGASATQHVVQNLVRDTTRDQDVRVSAVALCRLFSRNAKDVSAPQLCTSLFVSSFCCVTTPSVIYCVMGADTID